MNEKMLENAVFEIPEGHFCSENCSDCIYYERYTTRDDGRCWCNHYNSWYYPSERNGCGSYRGY